MFLICIKLLIYCFSLFSGSILHIHILCVPLRNWRCNTSSVVSTDLQHQVVPFSYIWLKGNFPSLSPNLNQVID